MPCLRCSARQTDPARGPSPWKSGVRDGRLVLVCPACQQSRDWTADLDRCAGCGSSALVRRLGETRCRSCGGGNIVAAVPRNSGEALEPAEVPGLADEVAAALARVFDR